MSIQVIDGKVSGNVLAFSKIEIRSTRMLYGNINASILIVKHGGV
jgi:cytoskeletal protein CcmA (bactofilin family)